METEHDIDERKKILRALSDEETILSIKLNEPTKQQNDEFEKWKYANDDQDIKNIWQNFTFEVLFNNYKKKVDTSDIVNIHTNSGTIGIHLIDGKLTIFSKYAKLTPLFKYRDIASYDFLLINDGTNPYNSFIKALEENDNRRR
jgi:hypothetical protein